MATECDVCGEKHGITYTGCPGSDRPKDEMFLAGWTELRNLCKEALNTPNRHYGDQILLARKIARQALKCLPEREQLRVVSSSKAMLGVVDRKAGRARSEADGGEGS